MLALFLLCLQQEVVAASARVYRMGPGLRINALHGMSDGTVLGAGWSRDLKWVPKGVPITPLSAGSVDSRDTTGQAVLVRWSAGLDSIVWVAAFPQGSVGPLRRIRSSEQPGGATGRLFLSGDRTVADPSRDGYFIVRIQGHLERSGQPSVVWIRDIVCPPRRAGNYQGVSQYKSVQAWDVDNAGRVFLARGAEADFDSAEVVRLDADGRLDRVAEFRSHVTSKGRVWRGSPSEFDSRTGWGDTLLYSRLFLKATDAQAPRSRQRIVVSSGKTTILEGDSSRLWTPDSAGGLRRGANPLDILFSGPCREYYPDPQILFADSVRCPGGRGWSGLSASSRATARIGGIVVDRRSNRWALGVTWNALGSDGSALDMPTVSVYESEGRLLWWSRLRSDADLDSVANSVPASLSEIQGMAVGQTEHTTGQTLVVQARGRVTGAFWGSQNARLGPGWRTSVSGLTQSGAEATWLAKLTLVNGGFLAATWQAAVDSGSSGLPLGDFHGGWPVPGSAGERLSSTTCHAGIEADEGGGVQTVCHGARPMTTRGAFQSVPSPGSAGPVGWNVLTVWASALEQPAWATAIDGVREAGDSGVAVAIDDHAFNGDGGGVVVGHVLRPSARVVAVAAPGWADSSGDVVLALLPRPDRVGIDARRVRQGVRPEIVRVGGRLRVVAPGEGDGSCRWVDASGRSGRSVPLLDGEAMIELPHGSAVRFLAVRRGGGRWLVAVPLLR